MSLQGRLWCTRGLAPVGAVWLMLGVHGCGTDRMSVSGGELGGVPGLAHGGGSANSGGAKGMTDGKASGGSHGNALGGTSAGGRASGAETGGQAPETGGQAPATGGASNSGGQAAASGGAPVSAGLVRSAGCGKAGANTTPRNIQITVAGTARQYYLSFPQSYDPNKAYALVFGFHGGGSNGKALQGSGVEDNSAGEAIFAYPDGLNGVWDLQNDGNDHKFDDAIFDSVRSAYCIDEKSVFAFGFSYGGWAATQIACGRPALIKGIVSIAGGGPMGNCAAAVPAMIVHGTNDGAEMVSVGQGTVTKFKQFNGCGDASAATAPSPCVSYTGCSKPLLWCEHPGIHEIPQFAQTGAWAFFASLR